jgi:hypothetical protein
VLLQLPSVWWSAEKFTHLAACLDVGIHAWVDWNVSAVEAGVGEFVVIGEIVSGNALGLAAFVVVLGLVASFVGLLAHSQGKVSKLMTVDVLRSFRVVNLRVVWRWCVLVVVLIFLQDATHITRHVESLSSNFPTHQRINPNRLSDHKQHAKCEKFQSHRQSLVGSKSFEFKFFWSSPQSARSATEFNKGRFHVKRRIVGDENESIYFNTRLLNRFSEIFFLQHIRGRVRTECHVMLYGRVGGSRRLRGVGLSETPQSSGIFTVLVL